jgi:beta-glucanase (GH16 family)
MPENEVYGVWPRSGEIDIAEARGNAAGYPDGGRDIYTSTLHWGNYAPKKVKSHQINPISGPSSDNDGFWRTTDGKALRRTDFSEGYHTFGLEWSQNYLFTYLDFQLQVFSVSRPSYYEFTDACIASSIPRLQRREKPLATRRLRQPVRE